MTKAETLKVFKGMAGYLQWATRAGESEASLLATLTHDIMGLAREEDCFCPRTNSYAKHFKP